jgi:hypothetical protein
MSVGSSRFLSPEVIGLSAREVFAANTHFVRFTGLPLAQMEETERIAYIRAACSTIGELTPADADPTSDVRPLESSSNNVPFHTDNPYLMQPEEIVSFWETSDTQEGGEHILLAGSSLVRWLKQQGANRFLTQLGKPARFMQGNRMGIGPILDEETGQVRFDLRFSAAADPKESGVAQRFAEILSESPDVPRHSFKLGAGDALFVRNRGVLHSRESYTGSNGVSYQARIRTSSQQ